MLNILYSPRAMFIKFSHIWILTQSCSVIVVGYTKTVGGKSSLHFAGQK
jgi:hypothetical protein